jgi:hypothetical protein
MNAKDAIRTALNGNHNILKMYVSDLSDADLLTRPVPGANHIAWQLGHVIAAEVMFQSPAGFRSKQEYLDLFDKVRGNTLATLDRMADADLDRPTPGRMAEFAPTLGAILLMLANHEMMHAGQFTVLRRKLGKPVLF